MYYKAIKGGLKVKVVFASTPDQEEKIKGLIKTFYQDIFPLYYSDHDIREFEEINVLQQCAQYGTLKEAYQVITSLQTLISILESNELLPKYKSIFQTNTEILKDYGMFFPFDYEQFLEAKQIKNANFSVYTKAANELLI